MTLDRRCFLKALALTGAALPLQPLWMRQALAQNVVGYPRLIGGPMVGAVDPSSARRWMRATGRFPVAVRYGRKADLSDARTSTAINATPNHDYVVKFTLDGLEPGTKYYYCPLVNEKPA